MVNFVEDLRSMKICEHLNQNVNENLEDNDCRFARLVNSAKEKHLQPKIVKYNKSRHKKSCWMSYGILESINTIDSTKGLFKLIKIMLLSLIL